MPAPSNDSSTELAKAHTSARSTAPLPRSTRSSRASSGTLPDVPDCDVRPFADDRFLDPLERSVFLTALEQHGQVTDHLLRVTRCDGSVAWIEITAATDPANAGMFVALVRDVSERKRVDDQSRDLYHQLLQAEKMAALGQTISGVAHELNNPLATILSWAERLAERPGDEKSRRGLDVISSESERAARIVRNLLTFARKRQSTRMMVDLNEVMRETLALRAYEQKIANIDVTQALATSVPPVFADSHQIKQVMLNLLINAEQAMIASPFRRAPCRPHVARQRSRLRGVRGQRRWSGHRRRAAGENLRSVLHDEGSRQRHRSRPQCGVRDRAGTRRSHLGELAIGRRARRSSSSYRFAARACSSGRPNATRCRSRRSRAGGC